MAFSRRDVVKASLLIPASGLIPTHAMGTGDERSARACIINITGIDAETTVSKIETVIAPLLRRRVPFVVTVSPQPGEQPPVDYELAGWLRKLYDGQPDQVDIALQAPPLQVLSDAPSAATYQLLRMVSDAQNALIRALNPKRDYRKEPVFMPAAMTVGEDWGEKILLSAVRPTGIRIAITRHPGDDTSSASEPPLDAKGVMQLFAAPRFDITQGNQSSLQPFQMLKTGITEHIEAHKPIVVTLPLQAMSNLSQADIKSYADSLAEGMAALATENVVKPQLPFDIYRQHQTGPVRYVVIRVDDDRIAPETDAHHKRIVDRLLRRGIPVSDAVVPFGYGGETPLPLQEDDASISFLVEKLRHKDFDIALHGSRHTYEEFKDKSFDTSLSLLQEGLAQLAVLDPLAVQTFIPPQNTFTDNTLQAMTLSGLRIMSAEHKDFDRLTGMDAYGVLHVSNTLSFEKNWDGDIEYWDIEDVLSHIGDRNDAVFMIHPQTMDRPEREAQVFGAIEKLSRDAGTKLVNLGQYQFTVMPEIKEVDLLQSSRAAAALQTEETQNEILEGLSEQLQENAAHAWRFFEQESGEYYGIVPVTAWEENGSRGHHPILTMWDVGSTIQATVAAHALGIIEQAELEKRAAGILSYLEKTTFTYGEHKLLNYRSHFKAGRAVEKGFDSTDTGRLLIALKTLDHHTGESMGIDKLVAGWNIETTIKAGQMQDVKFGKMSPAASFTYADYVSQGYRLWGIEHKLPFDGDTDPMESMDATMAFLQKVRKIGAFGTEPSLTEAIELGTSPYAQILADTLYMAQLERYETTGQLTCVSEGPIDRDPWFTYQGYQLDDEAWTVYALTDNSKWHTEAFIESTRVISSKAAFLWLAVRPTDYTRRLHDYIATKVPTKSIGFSAGLYEQGEKLLNVIDANTNGLILEAVSYVMNGRKPLLSISE